MANRTVKIFLGFNKAERRNTSNQHSKNTDINNQTQEKLPAQMHENQKIFAWTKKKRPSRAFR
ncbi:hypothetical protein ABLT31_04920 [Ammoniphilus sp. 3BR4]